jgi:hypothetical protein
MYNGARALVAQAVEAAVAALLRTADPSKLN